MNMKDKQERMRSTWHTLTMFAVSVVLMISCIFSKNIKMQTLKV